MRGRKALGNSSVYFTRRDLGRGGSLWRSIAGRSCRSNSVDKASTPAIVYRRRRSNAARWRVASGELIRVVNLAGPKHQILDLTLSSRQLPKSWQTVARNSQTLVDRLDSQSPPPEVPRPSKTRCRTCTASCEATSPARCRSSRADAGGLNRSMTSITRLFPW